MKDVLAFNGFSGFYRRFIKDYSKIVLPIVKLTKKDCPWQWTEECQKAFDGLKQAFTDAEGTVLAMFVLGRRTVLETDASDFVTAAVLSQYDEDNILRPIAYLSKKMSP